MPALPTHHLLHLLEPSEDALLAVKLPLEGTGTDEGLRVKLQTAQPTPQLCRRERDKVEVDRVRGWLSITVQCHSTVEPHTVGGGGGGDTGTDHKLSVAVVRKRAHTHTVPESNGLKCGC